MGWSSRGICSGRCRFLLSLSWAQGKTRFLCHPIRGKFVRITIGLPNRRDSVCALLCAFCIMSDSLGIRDCSFRKKSNPLFLWQISCYCCSPNSTSKSVLDSSFHSELGLLCPRSFISPDEF